MTTPQPATMAYLTVDELTGRRWELVFDRYPPSPNARMHFMAKASSNKFWRLDALIKAMNAQIPRLQRIRISAVIIRRALGTADEDNDRARLKPVTDGLVDAGVIPNDRRGCIEWGPVNEERGKPGLRLIVEEMTKETNT